MGRGERSIPTVGQLMSPGPIVVGEDRPLDEAARMLEEHDISGLPVIDSSGLLVGVLSQVDLLHARADEHLWLRWEELLVRDVMHSPVLTADRSMNVAEAATLMEEAHVHRLVVVDDDQQTPIGIVSTSDLIRSIIGERADT